MKRFFAEAFSSVLSAFTLLINLLVFFPAFFVLDFPLWLSLILAFVISHMPVIGTLLNIVLWIWALIVCLSSPVTGMSIIFYVLFFLYALDLAQAVVRTFLPMGIEPTEVLKFMAEVLLLIAVFFVGIWVGRESVVPEPMAEQEVLAEQPSPTTPLTEPQRVLHGQPRPSNGSLFQRSPYMGAEFIIKTPSCREDFYFILEHQTSPDFTVKSYIYPNSTVRLDVAPGTYDIYCAQGNTWYGSADMFGPDGDYYKFAKSYIVDHNENNTLEVQMMSFGPFGTMFVTPEEFPK